MTDFSAALDLVLPAEPAPPTPPSTSLPTTAVAAEAVAVQPDPNSFDAALDTVMEADGERRLRSQQVRTNILGAANSNPDLVAKSHDLGKRMGLPTDTVERNYPRLEAEARAEQFGESATLGERLHDWMLDPTNAKLVIDDIAAMQGIELSSKKAGGFASNVKLEPDQIFAGSLLRGVENAGQGFNSVARVNDLNKLATFDRIDKGDAVPAPDDPEGYGDMTPAQRAETRTRLQGQIFKNTMLIKRSQKYTEGLPKSDKVEPFMGALDDIAFDKDFLKTTSKAIDRFLEAPGEILMQLSAESAVYMIPTLVGSLVGPAGTFMGSALPDYASRFDDILKDKIKDIVSSDDQFMTTGLDPNDPVEQLRFMQQHPELMKQAQDAAWRGAIITSTADVVTMGLARPVRSGAGVKKNATAIGVNLAREVGMEGAQEAAARAVAGQDWSTSEVVSEMLGAGPMTAASTARSSFKEYIADRNNNASEVAFREMGDTVVAATQLVTELQSHAAEQGVLTIDDLIAKVEASKLNARSPEKMRDFLEGLVGDKEVFVPAEVIATYMQDMTGIERQGLLDRLGISGNLARIARSNEDIAIPLAAYVMGVGEAHAAWRNDIRNEVDGFSIKQAQEWGKIKEAETKAAIARFEEQIAAGVVDDPRTVVYQQVLASLKANGYTNDVAAQHAALYAARYHARAERNPGRYADALDAFQQAGTGKGVSIQTELAESTRVLGPDVLDAMLDSIRSGRDPLVPPPAFAHIEARKAAAAAELATVLPEPPAAPKTPKQIAAERNAAALEAFKANRQELADALASMGLDVKTANNAQIRDAIEKAARPAGQTFEQKLTKAGVNAPGIGVADENRLGFAPHLRVKVPNPGTLPTNKAGNPAPLITQTTTNKNAPEQIDAIGAILAKFPKATESASNWSKMMAYAFASDEVPVPPYAFLRDLNGDGAAKGVGSLTPGQIADATHGFEAGREFRRAYENGELDAVTTGKLFLWSFLSRGVSPYTQESLFIDAFDGADQWIRKAAAGDFDEKDLADYAAWASTAAPKGSGQPGAGSTHNLNAFGKSFLLKMAQKNEAGISHLQHLHNMLADPKMTGQQIRREFLKFGEGVGIDNKVVSFTLLVVGHTDVMVIDRVQTRQLWDDGRFSDINIYDGQKNAEGMVITGTALANLTYGARGLLVYEAIERGLQSKIEDIYAAAGRPQDASIGRYHWESWVAYSQQEASHGTLEAILKDAKGDDLAISQVTAKQGEYGAYEYGARYGRDVEGKPYFLYTLPTGDAYEFSVPAFRAFLDDIKKPGTKVVSSKFKVTESGNAPWYTRPEVDQAKLAERAAHWADRGDGTGEGARAVREAAGREDAADRAGAGDDLTNSEAFKRWFGGSKVVDESGRPRIAYKAMEGDVARIHPDTGMTHVSLDLYIAEQFSNGRPVREVYVRSENPFDFRNREDLGWLTNEMVKKKNLALFNKQTKALMGDHYDHEVDAAQMRGALSDGAYQMYEIPVVVDLIKARGHDGIYMAEDDGGRTHTNLAVFNADQVKLVGNTYDRAGAGRPGLTLNQPAYHGSPHVFDRFSLDKIGTGEGAQAFGWGLYFAGRKEIAEYYRDTLTGRTARGNQIIQYDGKMLVRADGNALIVQDDWRPDLEALVAEAVENGHTLKQEIAAQRQRVKDAGLLRRMMGGPYSETLLTFLERKDAKLVDMPKGRLFEVEIPDDGAYLMWDKQLKDQPPAVREAVEKVISRRGKPLDEMTHAELGDLLASMDPNGTWTLDDQIAEFGKIVMTREEMLREARDEFKADEYRFGIAGSEATGQSVYRQMAANLGSAEAASKALRDAGIPGIKYLDGSSRRKGDGTHNYVLFDDSLVEIKAYEQQARGSITFGDNGSIIRLFQGRDLSTLAHESGHLWLAELEFDVKHVGAGEQAKADWQTVLDFVGSTDGYITREQHELFARAFETYLMEGKAPSEGLRNVFRQFKAWLISIYRNLVKLQAPISPEMRQVFDRLLATDEEIAGAQNAQAFNPVFTDAKSAEMTEAEFQAYTKRVVQVVDEAEQKVLAKVMATIRRQRTKEVAAEKAKIRGEVKDELMAEPGQAALHFLRNGAMYAGETPEILKGRKLSRDALIALVGQEGLNALPIGVHAAEGISPDELAQVFGLGNGLELVERLMQVQAEQVAMWAKGDRRAMINARIAEETQRRLTESLGDPLNDGSIEAEAMAAVHSDKQGALMASELKVLARKAGHSGVISLDDIKAWAASAIGEMSSYQATQFVKYQRAERLAGQKVQRALVKGDFMAAFRAKQDQLVNFALYQEAKKAADDADSIRKRMDRYASAAQIKSMDQAALNAIHEILEEYDFKKRSGTLLAERTLFNAFAEQQKELGIEVLEPPRLKGARDKHFSQMTMDELRGLSDTVEQMAKLGRMKKELIDNQKKRDFEAVVAEGMATAADRPQRGVSRDDTGLTTLQERLGKLISGIKSGDSSLIKLETLFEWLDGDKTGRGIFTRLGFKPFADAQGRERDRLVDLNNKLKALYALVPDEQRAQWLEVHDIQALPKPGGRAGKFNKTQLIAMALNTGNQSSLEKLTAGMKWDEQAVRTTLDKYLTREEWQFVQNVWDLIDTQWPELKAVHERVTGLVPPKIEPIEVPTPFGPLRGGYYPAVYDPNLSTRAAKIGAKADVAATVGEIFPGGAFRPSTRAGATHARTGFEAPIRLSLDVIVQHLTDVAHDIEFREAILNAHKFFSDDRIKQAIIDAVGPEYEEQIDPWLKNIAHEWVIDRQGLNAVQKFANTLRTNVVIVGLGFRISTMLAQTAGYSNSVQRLGPVRMADGMRAFAKSPIQQFEFVHGKSAEMRHRANDLERDLRAAQLKMQGKTGFLNDVRRFAFKGIAWADAAVSIPTWIGAYNQGLAEHGMTDEQAVYYADKMVRDTQGSGAAKDMAAIQRGGPLLKLFTMFYSYFNVFYNRQRSLARDVRDPGVSWGSAVAQTFWLLVLPSLLSPLLTGQGPGDDEEWAEWAARNVFFGLFTGVPYGRDIANTASNKMAGKPFGDPKLSPVEGFGANLVRMGRDAANLVSGEETSKSAIKNLFNVAGVVTALPLGQPGSTAQYVWDVLIEGSENPENLLEWLRGLTIGPEHKR